MTPEPGLLTRLARLRREIDIDLAPVEKRVSEVADLLGRWNTEGSLPRPELVLLAVNLHGYYKVIEALGE